MSRQEPVSYRSVSSLFHKISSCAMLWSGTGGWAGLSQIPTDTDHHHQRDTDKLCSTHLEDTGAGPGRHPPPPPTPDKTDSRETHRMDQEDPEDQAGMGEAGAMVAASHSARIPTCLQ